MPGSVEGEGDSTCLRKPQQEFGSGVGIAFHVNVRIHFLEDVLYQEQAQTRAFRVRGEKRLKDAGQIFQRNSAAAVGEGDPDLRLPRLLPGAHVHGSAFRNELEEIEQQIDENPLNLFFISQN